MSQPEAMDIEQLQTWVGRQEAATDTITPELLARFKVTLGLSIGPDTVPPPGIHWCLGQPAAARDELGPDGHPARGGFLPPVMLTRRMWAASQIEFPCELDAGSPLTRHSTIAEVNLKHSNTGAVLVFVNVEHDYRQHGATVIAEKQSIVYRDAFPYRPAQAQPLLPVIKAAPITPDSTLLFRYSAITFNGHRIHYDLPYATEQEGYPGLVVQGPLMASLLMNLAQAHRPDCPLREFSFRAVAPAFAGQALQLRLLDEAGETLEIRNPDGAIIMTAQARFT